MGFNSFEFALFLPVVFLLYWYVFPQRKNQNRLLMLASYVFYGLWDWRFLLLILLSSWVDFYAGIHIDKHRGSSRAKYYLWLSLAVNLGTLFVFKYFGFFINSFIAFFQMAGVPMPSLSLNIILPVGISFYTFQTLSYTIDVYRNRIETRKNWVDFFAFVSFFPQLVAGPVERASWLLPQFEKDRQFNIEQAKEGLRFILYGLFKKLVIADFLGNKAHELFSTYESQSGSDLLLGLYFLYGAYIYTDFSAYSEIAIGTARLFGFKLSKNFAFPFFSRNIEEFWQRWHITISTWFRDYVLILSLRSPLRKLGMFPLMMLMFAAIGLWHGANYTFILWGVLNGLVFWVYLKLRKWGWVTATEGRAKLTDIPSILLTNFFIGFLLVFFGSNSLGSAFDYIRRIIDPSFFTFPEYATYYPVILGLLAWEWPFREGWHGLEVAEWHPVIRWTLYFLMSFGVMYHFGQVKDFVYFQF